MRAWINSDYKTFKRLLLLVGALTLIASGVMGQGVGPRPVSPQSWQRYTVKGEEFSVTLPNHPSMQTTKEKRPEKERRRRVLGSSAKDVVYTIHVVENPKGRQSLDAFIQEQTTSNPAPDLTSARDLTLDGITGKSFVYSDQKGMVQFFATEDRLYDFRAYGAPLDDARMTNFFSSVSLKKKDRSIEVFDGPGSFWEIDSAEVYKGGDVDTKVRMQSKPDPIYTSAAENERINGVVVLRCIFSSKGTVTNFQVIRGLPLGLTERAIEAARKIQFTPAIKDGKPVSTWMQLEYHFNLY